MLALLLTAMLAAPPAAAPPARPHWRVDWGEPHCMLIREGRPEDTSLVIRFVPAEKKYEVWIIDPRWTASSFGRRPPVQLVLDPDGGPAIESFFFLPVGKSGLHAVAVENAGDDFFGRLAKAQTLVLRSKGKQILTLPIPGAAAAIAATRACEDNMLSRWGVDPAVFRNLKERPRPINVANWISYTDYPDAALRSDAMGKTIARVDVAATGQVTGCSVVVTSGSTDLDKATCTAALRRGRFSPAIGADGKPVAAFTIFPVSWRIFG